MTAVAALLGAGFGIGWLLIIAGARRSNDTRALRGPRVAVTRQLVLRVAIAVSAAVVAGVLTRWPVGAVLAGIAAYTLPIALGTSKTAARALARTEAVANWAEMLRDNMAAAAGLEQAIIVTAPWVPAVIKDDIGELSAALRLGQRLPVALAGLRSRMHERTGRLVVRALLQASQRQSRDLAKLLTELAAGGGVGG
jgi:tight adherence protein B